MSRGYVAQRMGYIGARRGRHLRGRTLRRKRRRRRHTTADSRPASRPTGSWTETMETHRFPLRCAVVGRGRMGSALTAALALGEPLGRGADAADADVVLLAVPDAEIAAAAAAIAPGRLVGHLSGATTLDPLAPHEAFSLHPLMT